jgi:hypothetical protein
MLSSIPNTTRIMTVNESESSNLLRQTQRFVTSSQGTYPGLLVAEGDTQHGDKWTTETEFASWYLREGY